MNKALYVINRILLALELIPVIFLLLLNVILVVTNNESFIKNTLFILSIVSLIALIYVSIKTILGSSDNIKIRFIYFMHIGFLITLFGFFALLINGNEFKQHRSDVPYSIFIFGIVACVPYLHVFILNNFFKTTQKKSD